MLSITLLLLDAGDMPERYFSADALMLALMLRYLRY